MLPFRTILFPVDYSASCRAMAPYVRDMTSSLLRSIDSAYMPMDMAHRRIRGAGLFDPNWPERVNAYEKKRIEEFAHAEFPGSRADAAGSRWGCRRGNS